MPSDEESATAPAVRPLWPVLHFHSMSTSARRVHYTYAQYLALEEHSAVRHEFLDGEIYAMAGGSPDHAALAAASSASWAASSPQAAGPSLPTSGCASQRPA